MRISISRSEGRPSLLIISLLLCLLPIIEAKAVELPDFTALIDDYAQSVVNISITQKPEKPRAFLRPELMPEQSSSGSGFILSDDGYILTNHHVIEDAERILVKFVDRREFDAKLIGSDQRSDLALIKIEAKGLSPVKLGDSDQSKVGEWVLAIGSPFGFESSVTAGIISAKGRSLPNNRDETDYVPYIQTDVAINPGNSGGPLFNLRGEVIGVNAQIYTRNGYFVGLSFAIPANVAMNVVEQLKSHGRVDRGWLGVNIDRIDGDQATKAGLSKPTGALVTDLINEGPAARGGVKIGDIILEFNDVNIETDSDLANIVGGSTVGGDAKMIVLRKGKKIELNFKLGRLPDDLRTSRKLDSKALALTLSELTAVDKSVVDGKAGIRIVAVDVGPALNAGLQQGDIIAKLNDVDVFSVTMFDDLLMSFSHEDSVELLVIRRADPPLTIKVRLPDAP